NLQAFVASSAHAGQILTGTCAAPGSVLYALGDISADVQGTATGAKTLTGVAVAPPVSGWIVVVRSGPTAAIGTPAAPSPQAQPILCGPLSGGGAASASPLR